MNPADLAAHRRQRRRSETVLADLREDKKMNPAPGFLVDVRPSGAHDGAPGAPGTDPV